MADSSTDNITASLLRPVAKKIRLPFTYFLALRYLKPATGFREFYAYDNVLYIVAGALVEAVSGQSWEDFVTRNILQPVGMRDARSRHDPRAHPRRLPVAGGV